MIHVKNYEYMSKFVEAMPRILQTLFSGYALCPEKSLQFSLHTFNKLRHSFVIFEMNYPENAFY